MEGDGDYSDEEDYSSTPDSDMSVSDEGINGDYSDEEDYSSTPDSDMSVSDEGINGDYSDEEDYSSTPDSDMSVSDEGGSSPPEPPAAEEVRECIDWDQENSDFLEKLLEEEDEPEDKGKAVIEISDDNDVSDRDQENLDLLEKPLEEDEPEAKGKDVIEISDDNDVSDWDQESREEDRGDLDLLERESHENDRGDLDLDLLAELCIEGERESKRIRKDEPALDNEVEEMDEIAPNPPDLLIPLLRFQKEWLPWALKQQELEMRRGILADDMRMGKTIQAIALVLARQGNRQSTSGSDGSSPSPSSYLVLPETKCTLVICPTDAIRQWGSERIGITPMRSMRVSVYYGSRRKKISDEFFESDFVLTTYSTLAAEYRKVMPTKKKVKSSGLEAETSQCKKQQENPAGIHHGAASRNSVLLSVKWNRIILDEVRFLQITPYSYFFCMECDCKSLEYSSKRKCNCVHSTAPFLWWKRYISQPILALEDNVNQSIALRSTMKGRAAEISFPPKLVLPRRDLIVTGEEDYYKTLYNKSLLQFNRYAAYGNGTISNNFMQVTQLLTKLRQAAAHPFLPLFPQAEARKSRYTSTLTYGEKTCSICLDVAEDPAVTSWKHVFCKDRFIDYSAALGEDSCPKKSTTTRVIGTKGSSFISRICLGQLQTSAKVKALERVARPKISLAKRILSCFQIQMGTLAMKMEILRGNRQWTCLKLVTGMILTMQVI
ncbi:ATP-dependent helicase rhp16 isoform X2 [Macadamia integrifolia]|uniref:ATP-dependent helicase rhp16 isoform X2 n=1 Tax=Macadamia integrifolia TaxID=60698 RepID=UPI001C528408|nr:ATP-dependent helicase rhp16 isoform X2 [Macadamia integrifolia]